MTELCLMGFRRNNTILWDGCTDKSVAAWCRRKAIADRAHCPVNEIPLDTPEKCVLTVEPVDTDAIKLELITWVSTSKPRQPKWTNEGVVLAIDIILRHDYERLLTKGYVDHICKFDESR